MFFIGLLTGMFSTLVILFVIAKITIYKKNKKFIKKGK